MLFLCCACKQIKRKCTGTSQCHKLYTSRYLFCYSSSSKLMTKKSPALFSQSSQVLLVLTFCMVRSHYSNQYRKVHSKFSTINLLFPNQMKLYLFFILQFHNSPQWTHKIRKFACSFFTLFSFFKLFKLKQSTQSSTY